MTPFDIDSPFNLFSFLKRMFAPDFMPHGHCYFWRSDILRLIVFSEAVIVLSYYLIPVALFYLVRKRKNMPFHSLFALFGAFIFFCGTSHLMSLVTIWYPIYRFQGVVNLMTALVSAAATFLLFAVAPKILVLKSTDELEEVVRARTMQLVDANHALNRAVKDLEQAQAQQVQVERLRALGEMASGVAHDLNNALSPVLGYTQLMLDEPKMLENKSMAAEHLKIINTAARDAAGIVRRMNNFSRKRKHDEKLVPMDLNVFVEQTVSLTQPKWKTQAMRRGAEIGIEQDLGEVPPIEGDETELREALTNLIFNAVDSIRGKGAIKFRTWAADGHVNLEISDTGTGMTREVKQHCFEPFFSTKGEEGTGLGLSMVYGIMQRHNGLISVESAPGQGTCFTLVFRAAHPPALNGSTLSLKP